MGRERKSRADADEHGRMSERSSPRRMLCAGQRKLCFSEAIRSHARRHAKDAPHAIDLEQLPVVDNDDFEVLHVVRGRCPPGSLEELLEVLCG